MYQNMISIKELDLIIDKEECIIIDIRSEDKYEKSHIPSAIYIVEDKILEEIYKYKNYHYIIIYCDYGNSGLKAVEKIRRKYNMQNVYNLYGGYNAYKNRHLG